MVHHNAPSGMAHRFIFEDERVGVMGRQFTEHGEIGVFVYIKILRVTRTNIPFATKPA